MLRVVKAGLQTSIQDAGRPGWMRYGIARGGVADPVAMMLANKLLGNPPAHPCLEIALTGPDIEFECDLSIAVCGARFAMKLNGQEVENDSVIQVKKGDQLGFGPLQSGARAYLALAADMQITSVFGSQSTHLQTGFGGLHGRALKAGDEIQLCNNHQSRGSRLPDKYRLRYTGRPQLRVIAGAEASYLSQSTRAEFYRTTFEVTPQSNRMGIRLKGAVLDTSTLPQMTSSGLRPGTIQVPPGGQPIIAFVEGQTIGGYPRLAHVIEADQHILGQLKARDRANFELIELEDAHRIQREKLNRLQSLQQTQP